MAVTNTKNKILIIPINCVDVRLPSRQLPVWSEPLIVVDNIIQILETVETINMTHDAIQIKPPIKAHFRPKEFSSQAKTPPGCSCKAAPNSANIRVEGTKNNNAAKIYQIIPAYPIV